MKRTRSFVTGFCAALLVSGAGFAAVSTAANASNQPLMMMQDQQNNDQGEARREMKAGNRLTLRQIESRILPQMRGSEYLGMSRYDAPSKSYRLKFIKDGRVTYVDVDARTGKIINRSR